MKINFNSDGRKKNVNESKLYSGNFEAMLKEREKVMGKLQGDIQEILQDYHGQNIAIIVVEEDENGMPTESKTFIGGVSTIESQLVMGRSLNKASDNLRDMLIESAKGDVKKLLSIANVLASMIEEDEERE